MPEEDAISVFGYDKDADVYELLFRCGSESRARELAGIAARNPEELRRSGTGEPFDWLVLSPTDDPYDAVSVFSWDVPGGRPVG